MSKRNALIASLGAGLILGCSDILEKDLTGYGVVLITPPDGHSTTANVLTWRWEAVPEAIAYRLQIAAPDFQNPVSFVHDTLLTSVTFTAPLAPGSYRWRVRAENPNSHTDYYERSLTILAASSLEGLTPVLIAPAQGEAVRAEPLSFSWNALEGAEDYRFEIRQGSQAGAIEQALIVDGTSVDASALSEGTYAWGVQAQNSTSSSLFTYRSLRVDRTAPTSPVLLVPTANATLPNAPFSFTWQSGADNATTTNDSLFVLDGSAQLIRQLGVAGNSSTDSLGVGDFTWYVRTTDEAGNASTSTIRALAIE